MSSKTGLVPIIRKELYLDKITGGDSNLPAPITREEKYLAKIAGENIEIPSPVTRYEQYLAAISGEAITVPEPLTRLEKLLYKATGEDIEVDSPITREEMYWYDYESGGGETEKEYTGAVPTTITANGKPLLAWTISGNMQQTGTPSPTTPIQPQECGERTANLFDYATQAGDLSHHTGTRDYYLLSSGTEVSSSGWWISDYIEINSDSATVCQVGGNSPAICCYDSNKEYIRGIAYNTGGATLLNAITLNTSGAKYVRFSFIRSTMGSGAMLVEGSTAPSEFIPYGYKIPISSANTTTPVYLGEVESTRQIKKLVLTGNEDWTYITGGKHWITVTGYQKSGLMCVSSHYVAVTNGSGSNMVVNGQVGFYSTSNDRLIFCNTNYTTTEDWKSYLAAQYANGTPVTVWYVLATEETGIVNEPLRKIGDYADTISNVAEIPTTAGSQTFDVQTSLKPSEVYIKYRGKAVTTQLSMQSLTEVSSREIPEETEETENGSENVSVQHESEAVE